MSAPSILIIDDDPDFVEVTKLVLESKQYNVSWAYSPDDGMAKLEEGLPDLIILDIMMGRGAGGFVFARKIRKDPRYKDIPILMLTSMREQTGFDFPGQPVHDKFLPVDEYVEKPIEPDLLLGKVDRLLTGRRG